MRPNCLRRLVDSILGLYPDAHLLIADDSEPDSEVRAYYAELEAMGHQVLVLPFNVGISVGRNRLVEMSTRPYLLLLDDDFVFTSQTRIETLVEVMDADRSLGVAGGSLLDDGTRLRSYEYSMRIEDKMLHYYPSPGPPRDIAGHACYDTEIVLNFCLFRREVFSTTQWDESLKTSEHTDFFLRLATTSWKVVHVPSVVAEHYPETTPEYMSHRMNPAGDYLFDEKWATGAFIYHDSADSPWRDRWRVRKRYASRVRSLLRGGQVRQAGGLIGAAALAEARRLGAHANRRG